MFFKIANRTIDKIGRILRALLTMPVHHERDRQEEVASAENQRLKAEAEARYRALLKRRDDEDSTQPWKGQGYKVRATATAEGIEIDSFEPIPTPEIIEVPIESLPVLQPQDNRTMACAVLQDNRTLTCESQDTHQPENQMQRRAEVFEALDEATEWGIKGYENLIEYVRKKTGKGCSRRQVSRWQKERSAQEVA